MKLKFVKQSRIGASFWLLVLIVFISTCKFVPPLNQTPVAEFVHLREENTLRIDFYADTSPLGGNVLSYDLDGEIVKYEWDFGDGAVGEGAQTFHNYEEKGKYYVKLTVIDDDGDCDTALKEVEVFAFNAPPIAILSTNSPSNSENIDFIWRFDGSGSQDEDGHIVNYKFEIRRRSDKRLIEVFSGTDREIEFIFDNAHLKDEAATKFVVSLTVKDEKAAVDKTNLIIIVNNPSDIGG
jgi:hypothetical protein